MDIEKKYESSITSHQMAHQIGELPKIIYDIDMNQLTMIEVDEILNGLKDQLGRKVFINFHYSPV